MAKSKYSNFLTILLIVLIVIIIGLVIFFLYTNVFNNGGSLGKKIEEATTQFDSNRSMIEQSSDEEIEEDEENINEENQGQNEIEVVDKNKSNGNSTNTNKKTYYNGYVMLGYIEIPVTGIKYPVIQDITVAALETSVAAAYPTNAELNSPGNTVIIGHNYRNGKFFSNNKKLKIGDKIYITGNNGKTEYMIYEIYETNPTDTSFYRRDTGGVPEITLQTCTDDGENRLIIKARANQ